MSVLSVVATLVLLLGGCAAGGGTAHVGPPAGAGDPGVVALLEEALLTTAHLGEDFVVDDGDADEDDGGGLGCLGEAFDAIADEGGDGPGGSMAEGSWNADTDFGMPIVSEMLLEVGEDKASRGIAFLADELEGCDEIHVTDDDGSRIQLQVTQDDDAVEGADEQLNIVAAGTISAGGLELPFLLELRLASLGEHMVFLVYGNMAEAGPAGSQVMEAAVARAVAVLGGDEAPEVEGLLDDQVPDLSELEEDLGGEPDDGESA